MIDRPKTLADARKRKYGRHNVPYKEGYCAFEVWLGDRASTHYQCQRKIKVGIWCKQHDPKAEEKRRQASVERFERASAARARPFREKEALLEAVAKIAKRDCECADVARKALDFLSGKL